MIFSKISTPFSNCVPARFLRARISKNYQKHITDHKPATGTTPNTIPYHFLLEAMFYLLLIVTALRSRVVLLESSYELCLVVN